MSKRSLPVTFGEARRAEGRAKRAAREARKQGGATTRTWPKTGLTFLDADGTRYRMSDRNADAVTDGLVWLDVALAKGVAPLGARIPLGGTLVLSLPGEAMQIDDIRVTVHMINVSTPKQRYGQIAVAGWPATLLRRRMD